VHELLAATSSGKVAATMFSSSAELRYLKTIIITVLEKSTLRSNISDIPSEVSGSKPTGSFFYPFCKCSAPVGPLLTKLQLGEPNPAPSSFGMHSEKFP